MTDRESYDFECPYCGMNSVIHIEESEIVEITHDAYDLYCPNCDQEFFDEDIEDTKQEIQEDAEGRPVKEVGIPLCPECGGELE